MKVRLIAFGAVAVAVGLAVALGGWAWLTEDGNVEELLTETGMIGPLIFVVAMWSTQSFGVPGFVDMVPAGIVWPDPLAMHRYDQQLSAGGIWPVILLRLVFGQLPPADWLLGVSTVSTRNFLIGTGLGIVPGVVLFVVAGGGMYEYLADMSTATRRVSIVAVIAVVVIRRHHLRHHLRRRRAATVAQ